MNMPDVIISDALKNSPADLDIMRQMVLDHPTPWPTDELNKYLKTLCPQDLYMVYHCNPEQLFEYLYDNLGEPRLLRYERIKWENEHYSAPGLFEESFDRWEAWQKILEKRRKS